MCYSAPVSFTASAALVVVGFIGVFFALKGNRRFLALNLMAFFYAIQQFSEGMLWLGSPVFSPHVWGIVFLFFAFFVYPWYLAFGCYYISRKKPTKRAIAWVGILGLLYGAFLFGNVLMTPDLGLDQCRLHIFYNVQVFGYYHANSDLVNYVLIPIYVLLTCLPCFLSDRRYTSWIGWAILLSSVLCFTFYETYFISVWCFYAAVITIVISVVGFLDWQYKLRQLRVG